MNRIKGKKVLHYHVECHVGFKVDQDMVCGTVLKFKVWYHWYAFFRDCTL